MYQYGMGNSIRRLFCKVLCSRLDKWLESQKKTMDIQAGFRKGYCPIDQIIILSVLIRKYARGRENRLYAAFLDLRGAFDEVVRKHLIESLLQLGLPWRFVRILVARYSVVRIVVRVGKQFSRVIKSIIGVKQGCSLSPRLFSLFINDRGLF